MASIWVDDYENVIVVPGVDTDTVAQELMSYVPWSWTSQEAKSRGGVFRLLFGAFAQILSLAKNNALRLKSQLRIATATGMYLDAVGLDFFGAGDVRLPRNLGEADESYRKRIVNEILAPRATVNSIVKAVETFTGGSCQVFEPFNATATACWHDSFNGGFTPLTFGAWGNGSLDQFIAVVRPDGSIPAIANPNVGVGAFGDLNVIYTFYVYVTNNTLGRTAAQIQQVVDRIKPAATKAIIQGVN